MSLEVHVHVEGRRSKTFGNKVHVNIKSNQLLYYVIVAINVYFFSKTVIKTTDTGDSFCNLNGNVVVFSDCLLHEKNLLTIETITYKIITRKFFKKKNGQRRSRYYNSKVLKGFSGHLCSVQKVESRLQLPH